jgi:hypothetical protein
MSNKVLQFNTRVEIGRAGSVPVFASPDFARYLEIQRLRTGGDIAQSNNDLDGWLQFDVREADAAELAKRVRDIESNEPQDYAAMVAELSKRVASLEAELMHMASLAAQVAELSKRVSSDNNGMFSL